MFRMIVLVIRHPVPLAYPELLALPMISLGGCQ